MLAPSFSFSSLGGNTSERPIALLPTLIRWWEWLRAPAVVEWTGRHNVTCDAYSMYVVDAERAGW